MGRCELMSTEPMDVNLYAPDGAGGLTLLQTIPLTGDPECAKGRVGAQNGSRILKSADPTKNFGGYFQHAANSAGQSRDDETELQMFRE